MRAYKRTSAILRILLYLALTASLSASQNQRSIEQNILNQFSHVYNGRHLCSGDRDRISTPRTLLYELCFCDQQCVTYGDCCVDRALRPPSGQTGYISTQLGVTSRFYFTKVGCRHSAPDDDLTFARNRCLSIPDNSTRPDHLNDQPQFYKRNSTLYKNIYCILCNLPPGVNMSRVREKEVYKWRQRLLWSSPQPKRKITSDLWTNYSSSDKWVYNEKKREYRVNGSMQYVFSIDAEEFQWDNFTTVFNTRTCPPFRIISSCNKNITNFKDATMFCPLYTAYVYDKGPKQVYQNAHCAQCNGIPAFSLEAGLPQFYYDEPSNHTKGDFIPSDNPLECGQGEVPVLDWFCKPVLCEPGRTWNGVHCISRTGEIGCFFLILDVEWVSFMRNGSVRLKGSNQIFDDYSNITSYDGTTTHVKACLKAPVTLTLHPIQERVSEVCLISSSICLSLQIIVYLILPSLRGSRPGRIVLSLSLCILLGHITFLIKDDIIPGTIYCLVVGVLAHYFYLASFFWMLVMAIDSCRCLARNVFNVTGGHFLMTKYTAFSLLGSALIVVPSILVDTLDPLNTYAPKYGRQVCWIGSRPGFVVFFAIPILIILAINIILFIYTAVKVHSVQTRSKRYRSSSVSSYQNEVVRLKVYLRLAAVLGLTWIFGILSSLTNIYQLHYPFSVLGFAQGVFIFVAFTCKRRIWLELRAKLWSGGGSQRCRLSSKGNTSRTFTASEASNEDQGRVTPLLHRKLPEDGNMNGTPC